VPADAQPASGNADVDEARAGLQPLARRRGLLCDHRYRWGTVWRVTLATARCFLNAKVRVVSCRLASDGRCDVGCAFC
jgi:hypothetical protein